MGATGTHDGLCCAVSHLHCNKKKGPAFENVIAFQSFAFVAMYIYVGKTHAMPRLSQHAQEQQHDNNSVKLQFNMYRKL